jgi:hypothetical protein
MMGLLQTAITVELRVHRELLSTFKTLHKNVSLVQNARKTSVERSFFAGLHTSFSGTNLGVPRNIEHAPALKSSAWVVLLLLLLFRLRIDLIIASQWHRRG